ncbi:hypothetical protein ACNHKD_10155 [Methylocystis sp. JAN1]|uniref:hypothetical protein n=1 Tax=Methylocystis sp. JAN1 TaxID=3397211 RepID=UPI003FA2F8BD
MKFLLAACLAGMTGSALAQTAPPEDKSGPAPPARRWVKNDDGVWSRAEGAYHADYVRRGCRVQENWDGRRYTATVACAYGVKPN